MAEAMSASARASRQLRVTYAAPGLVLRPGGGPCEHFLSVCRALARRSDVELTVVMGEPGPETNVAEVGLPQNARFLAISRPRDAWAVTDSLALGAHPLRYWQHRRSMQQMGRELAAQHTDVLIERMWGFGGILGSVLKRAGAVFVLEENGPPGIEKSPLRWTDALRRMYLQGSRWRNRFLYRRADRILVQAEPLRELLVEQFGVPRGAIEVIPNAVDVHALAGRAEEHTVAALRRECGLAEDSTLLVYCGSLDRAHNVMQVAEALVSMPPAQRRHLQLAVLGNGSDRELLSALAQNAGRGVLHVLPAQPRSVLQRYLQAADLALAPYDASAFENGKFVFSSLKIREYLAAELPVAATAGAEDGLVIDGINGFQVREPDGWRALFAALPDRARLRSMGRGGRERVSSYTFDDVAAHYLEVALAARAPSRAE